MIEKWAKMRFLSTKNTRGLYSAWDVLYETKIPDGNVAIYFKNLLERSALAGALPEEGSITQILIKHLLQQNSNNPTKLAYRGQIKELVRQIDKNIITENDIKYALEIASRKRVVNVSKPLIKESTVQKANIEGSKPQLTINPQRQNTLDTKNIAHIARVGKNNDELSFERNKNVEDLSKNMSEMRVTDQGSSLDLNSLQLFLQDARRLDLDRQELMRETKQLYAWKSETKPLSLSGGNIFSFLSGPQPAFFGRTMNLMNSQELSSQDPVVNISNSSDVLLYNLRDDSSSVAPWKKQKRLIHVNTRDFFGIINASGRSPELMLELVTSLEKQGWDLVGDAGFDGTVIVFKREGSAQSSFLKRKILGWLIFALSSAILSFKLLENYETKELKETSSDDRNTH
ncbi:LAMI_0F03884g1_1 [Lachancea mirantina]|uniref:LAMI_0F03884g1_1 n=1 Tax=Lachancea mirantina TaxID=1230905 RepID=A0A1G4JXI2_9SACH|nr:LAMI_0F03884g1_1 [Lachancea mirantina]